MKKKKRISAIELKQGPFDGFKVDWPKQSGELPEIISFGAYKPKKAETAKEILDVKREIRFHRYESLPSDSTVEVLEDGLTQKENRTYGYVGHRDEDVGSIRDLWEST